MRTAPSPATLGRGAGAGRRERSSDARTGRCAARGAGGAGSGQRDVSGARPHAASAQVRLLRGAARPRARRGLPPGRRVALHLREPRRREPPGPLAGRSCWAGTCATACPTLRGTAVEQRLRGRPRRRRRRGCSTTCTGRGTAGTSSGSMRRLDRASPSPSATSTTGAAPPAARPTSAAATRCASSPRCWRRCPRPPCSSTRTAGSGRRTASGRPTASCCASAGSCPGGVGDDYLECMSRGLDPADATPRSPRASRSWSTRRRTAPRAPSSASTAAPWTGWTAGGGCRPAGSPAPGRWWSATSTSPRST